MVRSLLSTTENTRDLGGYITRTMSSKFFKYSLFLQFCYIKK